MSIAKFLKRTAIAATMTAAVAAYAQDIKLGFNGDLSASPSAQSGSGMTRPTSRETLTSISRIRTV